MSIEFVRPEVDELRPRISVIGVGGAGGNAIANMIEAEVQGVDFLVANTDAQALNHSPAERRIQLGLRITQGLGAGSRPEIGRAAAEETHRADRKGARRRAHVLHRRRHGRRHRHRCGPGHRQGGARSRHPDGGRRDQALLRSRARAGMRSADAGIEELQKHVDTLIVIPNQNLFLIANPNTTFKEAFKMADEVLQQGVRGITDLMVMPGLINLDFADVRSVMGEMGKAMMGTGEAAGDNRAIEAAEKAIANPLLDGVSMKGAKGVIVSITGGEDMRLMEVDEAANHIRELVDPDANIIWGSAFNNDLEGKIRVSVVATGIEADAAVACRAGQGVQLPGRQAARRRGAAADRPPAPVAAPVEPSVVADAPVAPIAAEADSDELLLGSETILTPPVANNPLPPQGVPADGQAAGGRRWLNTGTDVEGEAPRTARTTGGATREGGGTLFERMSSIARGAAKAQVEEEDRSAERRDPLDLPGFLNRQNNQ